MIHKPIPRFVVFLAISVTFFPACSADPPILGDGDYSSWDSTTDQRLDFPVPGHGEGLRRIYANPVVFQQTLEADGDIHYPDGSIFIKEVYPTAAPDEGTPPAMLVAMVKDSGDPRSRGGWLWLVRDPASGEETLFEDEFCVTCHTNANEPHPYGTNNAEGAFRDYVFHTPALEAAGGPQSEDR